MNKEFIKSQIEKLEAEVRENERQQQKACEYKRFRLAEEHEGKIYELNKKIRVLNRKLGIQSFDIGVDFEFEDETWQVCTCDELGRDCSAQPKGEELDWNKRTYFKIVNDKIVKS